MSAGGQGGAWSGLRSSLIFPPPLHLAPTRKKSLHHISLRKGTTKRNIKLQLQAFPHHDPLH